MQELDKTKVLELVCPALNILRAIELELTGCNCIYKSKTRIATDNLLKLILLAGRKDDE